MTSVGTVRVWHTEDGWGVLESADTPGGCWAHFSTIWPNNYSASQGAFRELLNDETVDFEWEHATGGQDGYTFRATTVSPRRAK